MRSIGMDVHRSFAQVAVLDRGKVIEEFRVELEYDAVVAFGQKLHARRQSHAQADYDRRKILWLPRR